MLPANQGERAACQNDDAGTRPSGLESIARPVRRMLGFAALTTVAVAAWLCFVILFVLPARVPSRIPMWAGVAAGWVGYSVL